MPISVITQGFDRNFFLICSEESTKENKKGGEWGTSINMICDSI